MGVKSLPVASQCHARFTSSHASRIVRAESASVAACAAGLPLVAA